MGSPIWTRVAITALTVCAVAALAAPASALTLRRDGSKAVPFVENLRPGLSKESSAPTGPPADGFDWGDAAIGAGLGGVAALVAMAGATAARRGHDAPRAIRPESRAARG
jgi:hypothetical protein